ncbi:hypothetical protein [Arachidicoccus sp.]|uniref:hypothetical protein n=1 Tax=Arachidicoccus sp. TaxID=1872624 RepID=UPI003D25531E
MQSFIVNIPEDKVAFFVELIQQLNLELLEIDEQQQSVAVNNAGNQMATEEDSFLDWEAELKSAKRKK